MRGLFIIAILGASFLGGAFAQTIGGASPMVALAATRWISLVGSVSGNQTPFSCVGGTCWDVNSVNVTGNATATGSSYSTTLENGFGVHHVVGGVAATGYFNGVYSSLQINAATGNK